MNKANVKEAEAKAFIKLCMNEFALEKQLESKISSLEKLRIRRLIKQCKCLKNSERFIPKKKDLRFKPENQTN